MLIASSALAERGYEPPVSIERLARAFIVNADGSYRETLEMGIRIETPGGVSSFGAKRIAYPSSMETIEAVEGWLIQPDGTKITVPAESIRDQDEDTCGPQKFGSALAERARVRRRAGDGPS